MKDWALFAGCTNDEILNFIAFTLFIIIPAILLLVGRAVELLKGWRRGL